MLSRPRVRNPGRGEIPAPALSAGASRSSDTTRTSSQTCSSPRACTTHSTGSAPRRHQRRRYRRSHTAVSRARARWRALNVRVLVSNDCERDAGGCDRDAVDVPTTTIRERMAESPSLCFECGQGSMNRVLRAGADAAAAREAQPAARVDHQSDRDERKPAGKRGRAGAEGDDRERAGCCDFGAAGSGPAQPLVLLAAGKVESSNGP